PAKTPYPLRTGVKFRPCARPGCPGDERKLSSNDQFDGGPVNSAAISTSSTPAPTASRAANTVRWLLSWDDKSTVSPLDEGPMVPVCNLREDRSSRLVIRTSLFLAASEK